MKTIISTATTEVHSYKITCDMCGRECKETNDSNDKNTVWQKDWYDDSYGCETSVALEVFLMADQEYCGLNLQGDRSKSYDICPKCFVLKLIPFIESSTVNFKKRPIKI